MSYTYADVETAIARANGQPLGVIKVGGFNGFTSEDLGPSRTIVSQGGSPYKKGIGHTYAHVATFTEGSISKEAPAIAVAQEHKSRWQNRRTCIDAAVELINSPQAQAELLKFDAGTHPGPTAWLKKIALTGPWYGYNAGEKFLREATTGSINFLKVGHSLFIYSCYPDTLVACSSANMPDLVQLFGPDW